MFYQIGMKPQKGCLVRLFSKFTILILWAGLKQTAYFIPIIFMKAIVFKLHELFSRSTCCKKIFL